jgi:hypothetical protein
MKNDWGYTSYEHTGWANDNDKKCYHARFMKIHPDGYETCRMYFYASRPILALRAICNSGKNPIEYDNAEVN